MRTAIMVLCVSVGYGGGCRATDDPRVHRPYAFEASIRFPTRLSAADIDGAARSALRQGEVLASVATYPAWGIGQSVVQVVAKTDSDSRAYVVDEDGVVLQTEEFGHANASL